MEWNKKCIILFIFIDYLEPVTQHVKQNFEYFNIGKNPNSAIHEKALVNNEKKNNYYNDNFEPV